MGGASANEREIPGSPEPIRVITGSPDVSALRLTLEPALSVAEIILSTGVDTAPEIVLSVGVGTASDIRDELKRGEEDLPNLEMALLAVETMLLAMVSRGCDIRGEFKRGEADLSTVEVALLAVETTLLAMVSRDCDIRGELKRGEADLSTVEVALLAVETTLLAMVSRGCDTREGLNRAGAADETATPADANESNKLSVLLLALVDVGVASVVTGVFTARPTGSAAFPVSSVGITGARGMAEVVDGGTGDVGPVLGGLVLLLLIP